MTGEAPGARGAAEPREDSGSRPGLPEEADRTALAAQALAAARAAALARGNRPAAVPPAGVPPHGPGQDAAPAGQPVRQQGPRPRRDDPAPLGTAIDGLIAETGWELAVATGSVFGRWAQIVGPDLAAHTEPAGLTDGELTVTADSTAWATQLRLLASELVRKLNAELGDGSVRRVKVLGPGASGRRTGQWRVRGGRGPRDTYG